MIDTIFNLLFHCAHRHLTRPFTPTGGRSVPHNETYVVCLDCTRQFVYDLKEMRIGKAISHTQDGCVVPPAMAKPRKAKLAYALGVGRASRNAAWGGTDGQETGSKEVANQIVAPGLLNIC